MSDFWEDREIPTRRWISAAIRSKSADVNSYSRRRGDCVVVGSAEWIMGRATSELGPLVVGAGPRRAARRRARHRTCRLTHGGLADEGKNLRGALLLRRRGSVVT